MNIRTCDYWECGNEFEAFPSNKKYCSITCKRAVENMRKAGYLEEETESDMSRFNVIETDRWVGPAAAVFNDGRNESLDEKSEAFLRGEVNRLSKLNDKYKNFYNEKYSVLESLIKDNVKAIKVPDYKPRAQNSKGLELVCNPWNADYQLGKRTPTYNTDVARNRAEQYTDQIIERTNALRDGGYKINKAHVYFLGDIVEGEEIFATQSHVIDSSVYEQTAKNAPEIFGRQINRLLEEFETIHIAAVIGNHGRMGRTHNPESNMDRVFYKILEHMYAYTDRVTFTIPDGNGESMFYAIDKIGSLSNLLVHGDQFGPPSTQNSYVKKVLGWKTSGISEDFNQVCMGHYHQSVKMTISDVILKISPSPESHNTFAQERLGVMGVPAQHMEYVDPKAGRVFWESDIILS